MPAPQDRDADDWRICLIGFHARLDVLDDFEKQMVAETPLGRLGQPEDIARVAVFLASDNARWLTGERITASGGLR